MLNLNISGIRWKVAKNRWCQSWLASPKKHHQHQDLWRNKSPTKGWTNEHTKIRLLKLWLQLLNITSNRQKHTKTSLFLELQKQTPYKKEKNIPEDGNLSNENVPAGRLRGRGAIAQQMGRICETMLGEKFEIWRYLHITSIKQYVNQNWINIWYISKYKTRWLPPIRGFCTAILEIYLYGGLILVLLGKGN